MNVRSDIAAIFSRPAFRCLGLIILLTACTRIEPLSSAVLDPDLWWHLRGGQAIVATHAVPHHGVFTQHTERPWVEYSWGFEVLAFYFYKCFGLVGIVFLRSLLEVIITAILFVMLRRSLESFWQAWLLTALGMWTIHRCLGPQPMLSSIAMFILELALVFESRRRNSIRPLIYLPFLFLVWANLHIQFIYGLLVLALLSLASLLPVVLPAATATALDSDHELPLRPLLLITVGSFLATFVSPYGPQLYRVLAGYVQSRAPYAIISELQAPNFRIPAHFVLVLIICGAFFSLGWRRSFDAFKLLLLIACTVIGLHMERDLWVPCLPALAIISERRSGASDETPHEARNWRNNLILSGCTLAGAALVFALVAWDSGLSNTSLNDVVAHNFPAEACLFIKQNSLPGPIYNEMNWGGYVIWNLPDRPVAIDNRTDLYGDELLSRFYAVQNGWRDWKSDPDLISSRLLLLSPGSPLTALLVQDAHFHLAYRGRMAVVLTHDPGEAISLSSKFTGANLARKTD